jgi:predicted outer membrane repeat protein
MSFFRTVLASIPLLAAVSAHAAPKNFHVGAGCTYATIQAALDAERMNPGTPADFIWVANNQSYTAQDIQVHDQNVFLYGGVSDCVDSSISGTTTLSGSGGAAKSVMTVSGHSLVWLGGLTITQGDNTSSGVGGGINFAGTGKLTIGSSTVTNNHAGYGGGINFNGTGGASDVAELWINYETLITNNSAGTSGGGIRIEGHAALRVLDEQVWIALNHADGGFGGGIQVIGPASADLGSPGYRLAEYVALMYGNTAQYGGGLAVTAGSGDNQNGLARLFSTNARHPVRFDGNIASHVGGAIYAHPNAGVGSGDAGVCGSDYRISSNSAQEGSAIYADEQYDAITGYSGASVSLSPAIIHGTTPCGDVAPATLGAVECTAADCNLIDGNVAQNVSGQATAGSTVLAQSNAFVSIDRGRLVDNHGAHVLRVVANDSASSFNPSTGRLSNCLVAGNVVTGDLVVADSDTTLNVTNCTIADNQIGSGAAVRSAGILDLFDDIVAQGQTTTLAYTGGNPVNLTVDHVLSMEVASLAQGAHVVQADPSFVNPSRGDYRLLPFSLAIDRAPAVAGDDRDLDGHPHDQDIGSVPNLDGVRDLGAYERQVRYCGAADTMFCSNFDYD